MRITTTTLGALAIVASFAAATPAVAQQGAQHAGHAKAAAPADASQLRAALNTLLQEHAYLAAAATNAALGGRDAEFKAAAGALDANSVALSKAIESVYGKNAGDAFLPLWRSHIGMVVDYTVGVATKDAAKRDKAVNDLLGYTEVFAGFLAGANPNLPKAAVASLVKTHVLTLKDVIDLQAKGDQAGAYAALRTAASHMGMIADPLAAAIAKQFPAKFSAR